MHSTQGVWQYSLSEETKWAMIIGTKYISLSPIIYMMNILKEIAGQRQRG